MRRGGCQLYAQNNIYPFVVNYFTEPKELPLVAMSTADANSVSPPAQCRQLVDNEQITNDS